MLFLLGVFLSGAAYYLFDRKIRHRQRRKRAGLALITVGATATFTLDTTVDEFYMWGFVVVWCIGLELFFNCDKYQDEYD